MGFFGKLFGKKGVNEMPVLKRGFDSTAPPGESAFGSDSTNQPPHNPFTAALDNGSAFDGTGFQTENRSAPITRSVPREYGQQYNQNNQNTYQERRPNDPLDVSVSSWGGKRAQQNTSERLDTPAGSLHDKDIALILAKLDAIRSQLDAMHARIEKIERIADHEHGKERW